MAALPPIGPLIPTSVIIFAVVIVLVAGTVSGLTGFGFVLVSVTPLLLVFDPATVVMITLSLNLLTSIVVTLEARQKIRWRTVLSLLPWASAGLYAGVILLKTLDAAVIKLIAGGIVGAFALLFLTGRRLPGTGTARATAVAGVVSGVLTTSTGLTGPPIVVLLTGREFAPQPFRASAAAFFVPIDVFGIATLISQGTVRRSDLGIVALLAPIAIGGTLIGGRLARHVSVAAFRRIILILLLLTGIVGSTSAVLTLLRPS
jgi:hypothetical protein